MKTKPEWDEMGLDEATCVGYLKESGNTAQAIVNDLKITHEAIPNCKDEEETVKKVRQRIAGVKQKAEKAQSIAKALNLVAIPQTEALLAECTARIEAGTTEESEFIILTMDAVDKKQLANDPQAFMETMKRCVEECQQLMAGEECNEETTEFSVKERQEIEENGEAFLENLEQQLAQATTVVERGTECISLLNEGMLKQFLADPKRYVRAGEVKLESYKKELAKQREWLAGVDIEEDTTLETVSLREGGRRASSQSVINDLKEIDIENHFSFQVDLGS